MLLLLLGRLPRSRRCDAAGAARAARPGPQAESSERPLRRRAARMARPARVRMRRRKPWVLARRRLLGWKVRLLTMISVTGRTRVVRECLRWWAAIGRNRKPASGSRACENGRHGRIYGTRARVTGSNQHGVQHPPPRFYQLRTSASGVTRGGCREFLCSELTNFDDQVAGLVALLLASPSAPRLA